MPMQENMIINFCRSWKRQIHPLSDIEFQKKSWFHQEGTEVSTFEEETGNLIQRYEDHIRIPEYQLLYQNEAGKLIKLLCDKVDEYRNDSHSLLNSDIEEKFFSDSKWLSIVSLAKKVDRALDDQIKEVENGHSK